MLNSRLAAGGACHFSVMPVAFCSSTSTAAQVKDEAWPALSNSTAPVVGSKTVTSPDAGICMRNVWPASTSLLARKYRLRSPAARCWKRICGAGSPFASVTVSCLCTLASRYSSKASTSATCRMPGNPVTWSACAAISASATYVTRPPPARKVASNCAVVGSRVKQYGNMTVW